jgi:tRNA(Ile)-lysidine synthase
VSDLLNQVGESIAARKLFVRGGRVLVAVSGGLDSMVLLHLLARLSPVHGWRLTVAHFNHRLRGRSSEADERLVRATAKKLGLLVVADGADVRKFARAKKISLEMAARKLRHAFLARAARKRGIRTIALAHHADDQVELFFIRLLRGAGGEGLAGMKWQSPSPADPKTRLVRPLLEASKPELRSWATREGVFFREDASNAHLDIQRNRIRHELLPLLAKHYQPALAKVVQRQMNILGAEAEFAGEAANNWLKAKRRHQFEHLPLALQRRCLQLQLVQKGVAPNYDLIEEIREAANSPVAVNGGMLVSRDKSGAVKLHRPAEPVFSNLRLPCRFKGRAGEFAFENARFSWEIAPGTSGTFRAPKRRANREYFDADKVGGTIVLRHWQPGDRFQPIGMGQPVKLQDLFTNQKILRSGRRGLIVGATAGGKIFWVEGLRMAERFKLDNATTRQLHWQWKRL